MNAQASFILKLVALAVIACVPLSGESFYIEIVGKILVMAIFAMSLDLLVGFTGLVSFGHAAYFGIAAYAVAILSPEYEAASLWYVLPASVGLSALAAFVIGLFVLRTKGIYFIMVTLAFAQMAYYIFHDTALGRSSDGIYLNVKPDASLFGWTPFSLDEPLHLYYFILAAMVAVFVLLAYVLRSPFGRVLAGIHSNEHRMKSLGYSTFRYKLAAFTLAGALAGLAGYLWGAQTGFVNPELMGFHMSAHAIMMVILGGMGNFAGAIVGAFAFEFMLELFKDLPAIGEFNTGKHWQLWMGLFIVAVIVFAPRGLLGLLARFTGRKGGEHE